MAKQSHNILLVDDNRTTISLNKLLIEKVDSSAELLTATDGKAALAILQEFAQAGTKFPDVILVDLKMPVMNGIEFYQKFKQYFDPQQVSDTKIVMLTTSLDSLDMKHAKDAGIEYYLNKPLTTTKLQEVFA
ncbi:MAG: response regulator [Cytophagales bacterium CG18_big_fil_WC_8_21_14_2_50_42_9]|nr:MAG: response regulator [Cytophagales bacterium CG18_big_fil_WC_8_21_14_2_50_42_9]